MFSCKQQYTLGIRERVLEPIEAPDVQYIHMSVYTHTYIWQVHICMRVHCILCVCVCMCVYVCVWNLGKVFDQNIVFKVKQLQYHNPVP